MYFALTRDHEPRCIRRAARPLAAPSGFALRAQATRRLRRGRISPLVTPRLRRGMKVAFASPRCFVVFVFAATFARRLRAVATVGRRQMPATRIGLRPTRIYTNEIISPTARLQPSDMMRNSLEAPFWC